MEYEPDSSIIEDDITKYSIDELKQLKDLFTQSLNHYTGLLKDEKLMSSIKDGDIFALKLCLKETEDEIKKVDDEMNSRDKK